MLSLLLLAAGLLAWPERLARTWLRHRAEPPLVRGDPVALLRLAVLPAAALLGLVAAGIGGLLAASALAAAGRWWWRARSSARRQVERSAALAAGVRLLVAELRAGSHPAAAAEGAAADAPPPIAAIFRDLAATARLGGDVGAALISAAPERPRARGDPLARVARAWALAERHGVALAELLEAVRRDLDHRVAFARETEAKLAGPRATAAVLAGLPLLGVLLGEASGADPLAVLSGTVFGQVVLVAGVALLCLGALWTVRLTEAVVRP